MCPTEFTEYDGRCYKYYASHSETSNWVKKTWDEARDACSSLRYAGFQFNLASVHSEEVNEFIVKLITRREDWPWIGLKRILKPNDFKWTDGSPFSYNKWREDEPNNVVLCSIDIDFYAK